MDLKALIAKMDQIESKQLLNEGFPTVADAKARADKEKTTGKFDKKELSTGTQYTRKSSTFDDGGKDKDQKKAEKKKKNEGIFFKSSIAQELLREFNLEEAPVVNPYQGADAAKFAALSPADQAWLTKGGGAPDINDEFILARAPNKGKAVAAPAAAAPAAVKVDPADLDRADQEMGAAMTANAAAAPAAATAAAPAADPKKIARFKELLAKAGGAAAPAATAAPAAGGAAQASGSPAKPAAGFANTGGGAAVGNPNMTKQGVAGQ
jgi:hypothetical protein